MKNKFQQQREVVTFLMYSCIKPLKLSSGCTALHICNLSHAIKGSGQSMAQTPYILTISALCKSKH